MTETIADRYRRRAAAFTETLAAVPGGAWANPSPCQDWDARGVVDHVVGTQGMFETLVGRRLEPGPSVGDDPQGAWASARDQVQAHLDDPATAEVEFDGFFGRSSFEAAVDRFLSGDLVMHRWDLARAAGVDDTFAPGEVEACLADVEVIRSGGPELEATIRSPQVFGPELSPPDGADDQTRVLAFFGRRAW